ncbi:MAG: GNAT family protein [Phycisphaerae bacterium]
MRFPFTLQILTTRCRLRCVSEADIPHVWSATRHAGFNDGMTWNPPANMDELRQPLQRNLEAWRADRDYTFTIESKSNSMFLGRIVIRQTTDPAVWNIGFWTHPDHQNQGYMTEAARAMVDFGFQELGAVRIEAAHALWNIRSERVLKKLGMKFVRHIPQGFMKNGQWVEENALALERAQWEASRPIAPSGSPGLEVG